MTNLVREEAWREFRSIFLLLISSTVPSFPRRILVVESLLNLLCPFPHPHLKVSSAPMAQRVPHETSGERLPQDALHKIP